MMITVEWLNIQRRFTYEKYKDLISLCEKGVIPKRFYNDYRQLPTHSSVKDRLAETDEKSDDEDNE